MSQRKLLVSLALVITIGLAFTGYTGWTTYAQGPDGPCEWGPGMMMQGWTGADDCPYADDMWGGRTHGRGYGMMGNSRGHGMMSGSYGPNANEMWDGRWNQSGPGMMGSWSPSTTAREVTTIDAAVEAAEAYIAAWVDENLALGEVMQFDNHFYAQAVEVDSGRGAFEFLIDPATGTVYPEHGPNMMWNLGYGMHSGRWGMMQDWDAPDTTDSAEMTVSVDAAQAAAQAYLDEFYPGMTVDEGADTFYGYYTLHILEDGAIVGMLSVNGTTEQVWLHNWHGEFVDMIHAETHD